MRLTEALLDYEKSATKVEKKKTLKESINLPLRSELLKSANSVNTRNCRTNFDKTLLLERALQEGIQKVYPDKHWTDITSCDIHSTLLENDNNVELTIERILKESVDPEKKTQAKRQVVRKKSLTESLKEDTVKQGSYWVNKGKEGTHGKFKTKKAADAQRRAMFARGYKESLDEGWYRGADGIEFVYHGQWGDPDLVYNGYTFNYWDIEDALWNDFLEETGHSDNESDDPEVEREFNEYVQEHAADYLDDVIAGGYFAKGSKSWHDRYNESVKTKKAADAQRRAIKPRLTEAESGKVDEKLIDTFVAMFGGTRKNAKDKLKNASDSYKKELLNWFRDQAKKGFLADSLTEAPVYELKPQFDARKSFYGKAQVDTGDKSDKNKLYSYGTLVAEMVDGKPVVHGTYSATTLRHIKDWLRQNGFRADSAKQIMNDYGESLKEGCKKECVGKGCKDSLTEGSAVDQIEDEVKGITKNFTKKSGTLTAWTKEQRDTARKVLRQHYKTVEISDGRMSADEDPSYVIAYSKPLGESLKESYTDDFFDVKEDLIDRARLIMEDGEQDKWEAARRAIEDGLFYDDDILAVAREYDIIDTHDLVDKFYDYLIQDIVDGLDEDMDESLKEGKYFRRPLRRGKEKDEGLMDLIGKKAVDFVTGQIGESTKVESLKNKKSLTEGTSNFWTADNLPLLVFVTYDEVENMAQDEAIYELGNDADEDDILEFEEKFIDNYDVCMLDEDEIEELKSDIDSHNREVHDKFDGWDDDEEDPGYWESVDVELKPGYYEGAQLWCNDRDMRPEELEAHKKFFEEMKNKYGLTELKVAYRFSNGETGYSKVESLKNKKMTKVR